MKNDASSHWNAIKKELGLRQAGNDDFIRWTANQKELYAENGGYEYSSSSSYGLVIARDARIFSHPLLGIVSADLPFASLIRELARSDSGSWTLIETVDEQPLKGWIPSREIDLITTAAYKLFSSDPGTRYTFLNAQLSA